MNRQTIPTLTTLDNATLKGFNFIARTYNVSGPILVDQKTFAFMFTNLGNVPAEVNGVKIYPGDPGVTLGDSRSVGTPSPDMEFKGQLNVVFLASANVNTLIEVVTLYYT